jgi:outer membrane protein assembly factor BamB
VAERNHKNSSAGVLDGGRVFVTTSYGVGSKLFRVFGNGAGQFATEVIWESNRMKSKFNNVAHKDGFIYGLDDGILACLDVATGERRWKGGRYGHGQLLLVDNLLLITTEKGGVALVEATPDAYKEVAFMQAIKGKTWNNPALVGQYLLVRNSEEAACFRLPIVEIQ